LVKSLLSSHLAYLKIVLAAQQLPLSHGDRLTGFSLPWPKSSI
jgi:hypothetical protein